MSSGLRASGLGLSLTAWSDMKGGILKILPNLKGRGVWGLDPDQSPAASAASTAARPGKGAMAP